jgi:hypothetical protein
MSAPIEKDRVYRFAKSGNLVRTERPTDYGGKGSWVVTRVSSGKEMIVPGRALVDPNHDLDDLASAMQP